MTFALTPSRPADAVVRVRYATPDGTAAAESDHARAAGTLTFLPGETRKTVTVFVKRDKVKGDKTREADEAFFPDMLDPVQGLGRGRGRGAYRNDNR